MDRAAGLAIALACVVAACGRGESTSSGAATTAARVGRPAPSWTEPSIPGPTLSLSSLRGKAVYLNFFATWCPPCGQEAPSIEALSRRLSGDGLQVVGVDVLENPGKAAQFRREHDLSYPVVVDNGALRQQYQINGLPVHVFIDRSGIVRKIVVGEMTAATMQTDAEQILR
jgi:cytochrome c biogenesis protein CcmG, thiol:disulfide interchange protein DsbE